MNSNTASEHSTFGEEHLSVPASERADFVVVANRLPVQQVVTEGGEEWRPSPGGQIGRAHV